MNKKSNRPSTTKSQEIHKDHMVLPSAPPNMTPMHPDPQNAQNFMFFSILPSMVVRRGKLVFLNRKRAPMRSFCTRF